MFTDIFKQVIDNKQYNVILSVTLQKKDYENSVYGTYYVYCTGTMRT
jgi:hypothetical protein